MIRENFNSLLVNNKAINYFYVKLDKLNNRIENHIRLKKIKPKDRFAEIDNEYEEAVILIHSGRKPIPAYVVDCIEQIRLFDKSIAIIFVCDKRKNVSDISKYCKVFFLEEIALSRLHIDFLEKVSHMNITHFFQLTIERFFILYDIMNELGIRKCLHLENDNLLYCNATDLINKLSGIYTGIATPRVWLYKSCASVMFVPSVGGLADLLYFINCRSEGVFFNDMYLLPAHVDMASGMTLPVVYESYVDKYGLKTYDGISITDKENKKDYCNNAKKLEGIFDCAPLGQYLDGCDIVLHPKKRKGFINRESYIDPTKLKLHWSRISDDKVIPYVCDEDVRYRVYNLHIHSKRLNLFRSDRIKSKENG